jgi:hypothetical protein
MAGRYDRAGNAGGQPWQDVVQGDELRRAQRQIDEAMRAVVADALRPKAPPEPLAGQGVPTRHGVPLKTLEMLEEARRERERQAQFEPPDPTRWRKPKK